MRKGQPSPQDMETLCMLFKGLTYSEIAKQRNRSLKTVNSTVNRLLDETGCENSRELIYEALTCGWLKPPKRYVD